MKISSTHYIFSELLNAERALECPEEFLGPNWKDVLNFWIYLDTLSVEQRHMVGQSIWDLADLVGVSSFQLAWDAACGVTNVHIANVVFDATSKTSVAGCGASRELIGAHKIFEQGNTLTFVPLFLNL